MEKEPWEDIEIELLGVVGAIQSDELIQRFSKSVLKAREAYLNARREGYEDVVEILKGYQPLMGQHEQNLLQEAIFSIGSLKAKLNN